MRILLVEDEKRLARNIKKGIEPLIQVGLIPHRHNEEGASQVKPAGNPPIAFYNYLRERGIDVSRTT